MRRRKATPFSPSRQRKPWEKAKKKAEH